MKTLILVRHGMHGDDGHLTQHGRAQIRSLAEELKTFTEGTSLLILNSPIPRAYESAEILASSFRVAFETSQALSIAESSPTELTRALGVIEARRKDADVLMLVAHSENVSHLPKCFAKELGKTEDALNERLFFNTVEKGEAWVLDFTQKTLTHARP